MTRLGSRTIEHLFLGRVDFGDGESGAAPCASSPCDCGRVAVDGTRSPIAATEREFMPTTNVPAEIVLICNPRAGGRWKELARVLDSDEGRSVRRIVTDSVDDIAPAIADLGQAQLLCVYGGDGTIQRILDHLSPRQGESVRLAFVGGGTMNVTARWCGLNRSPADNFREVVREYLAGRLLFRETNLLHVHTGERRYRGFTFGLGPIVRLLDAYERGRKGKLAALATAARGVAAALSGFPSNYARLLEPFEARVVVDDDALSYDRFVAVFANVTGQINPGVVPFVDPPTRDSFHYAAYAVSAREFTMNAPVLMRGWLPVDPKSLIRPDRIVRRLADSGLGKDGLPTDPRYINRNGRRMEIETDERLFTVDGELFTAGAGAFRVTLGMPVRLAVSSRTTVRRASAMAARRYFTRD
jgi:diacylglycerol kinase family enzyme